VTAGVGLRDPVFQNARISPCAAVPARSPFGAVVPYSVESGLLTQASLLPWLDAVDRFETLLTRMRTGKLSVAGSLPAPISNALALPPAWVVSPGDEPLTLVRCGGPF